MGLSNAERQRRNVARLRAQAKAGGGDAIIKAPAALHRISFAGEDTPSFFTIGSWFVILAPAPLAIGIAGDLYVATSTAAASLTLGAILALAVLSLLACLWYVVPMALRAREGGR